MTCSIFLACPTRAYQARFCDYRSRLFREISQLGFGRVLSKGKNGSVFFEIGAHVGFYTLLVSSLVSDNGKVFAFEPPT